MTHWSILFSAACLIAALAGVSDVRTGLIPNKLTLPALLLGIPAHVFVMQRVSPAISSWLWLANAVGGALICTLVPLILWRYGGMGGGDMKLFAALGALLGVRAGLEVQLVTFSVAALAAPAVLAFRGRLMAFLKNVGIQLINPFLPKRHRRALSPDLLTEVRFGPLIFAGTALVACTHL